MYYLLSDSPILLSNVKFKLLLGFTLPFTISSHCSLIPILDQFFWMQPDHSMTASEQLLALSKTTNKSLLAYCSIYSSLYFEFDVLYNVIKSISPVFLSFSP